MRLLHVSDWHLGRETSGVSRRPDHEAVLAEIVDIARQFRPHLVVHTGDVFDSGHPGADDIELAFETFNQLADLAPLEVIAGNHDSPRYFRSLTKVQGRNSRIRLMDRPRLHSDGGVVEHPGEPGEVIRLAALPFIQAGRAGMIECFSDQRTWHGQYADGVRLFTNMLAEGLRAGYDPQQHVLVFATHLYIDGAVKSGSERQLHITDAYAAQSASVPTVSYAAFGHIHKPQRLKGPGCACYAGSPIQMDFGEEGEEKSVVLVEAAPGRAAQAQTVPLRRGRPLRSMRGTLAQITEMAPQVGDALCRVVIETETITPDLSERVRELLPRATLLSVDEDCAATRVRPLDAQDASADHDAPLPLLFHEFLETTAVKGAAADKVLEVFGRLVQAAEDEATPTFTEEEALHAPLPVQRT
jgi:DNA repair protein SbcD/Mre11